MRFAMTLTSHRCPLSHTQETVMSSCPMRSPLWAQLSLSCSRRCVQDGFITKHVERGSERRTGLARHGLDTFPLDNPANRRDNGRKPTLYAQAPPVCTMAT